MSRLLNYLRLMRLHRPIGIFLLLWPCLWALWIAAKGVPETHILVVFVCGVILMRSAGCVLNDIADHRFDPHVERTKDRPIASGEVGKQEALVLFAILCLLAFALVLTLNQLTILLSLVAVLLAAIYPFMKRYTYLPQVFLGLAFGWSVPMAFAAVTGAVPPVAWLLLLATVVWATAYDTIYAMMDREEDLRIGVKSTAILFGEADRFMIGALQVIMVFTLLAAGRKVGLGSYYHLGLLAAAGLMLYQHKLIYARETPGCLKAFKNNNWVGLAIFAGIAWEYMA
ncbi:MAG: 4-hydroxybenzoate octaprenyltransferase [Pseudomonadota bacterium]